MVGAPKSKPQRRLVTDGSHAPQPSARRMGGAKRYPSIASYGGDGFRGLNPSYVLRLGRIPFEIVAADVAKLNLLRVEIAALADVGSLTPHLGGGSFRYDPLPASLVSHRRRLRFVYFDGEKLRPLTFTDVRAA